MPTDKVQVAEIESFLSFLFGKWSTHLPQEISLKSWKKYCKKLIDHLDQYISANVVTDLPHQKAIDAALEKGKRAVTSSNAREPMLVASLAELCFLLLGDRPNHWNRRRVNRPEHFMLDTFRTVNYSRSPKQRANWIIKQYFERRLTEERQLAAVKPGYKGEAEKIHRLLDKYYDRYDRPKKHAEFVRWFRGAYPKEYRQLFEG